MSEEILTYISRPTVNVEIALRTANIKVNKPIYFPQLDIVNNNILTNIQVIASVDLPKIFYAGQLMDVYSLVQYAKILVTIQLKDGGYLMQNYPATLLSNFNVGGHKKEILQQIDLGRSYIKLVSASGFTNNSFLFFRFEIMP